MNKTYIIDGRSFNYPSNGISNYLIELANFISKSNKLIIIHQNNYHNDYSFNTNISHIYEKNFIFKKLPPVLWSKFRISKFIKNNNSILITSTFVPFFLKNTHVINIIYDLSHLYSAKSMSIFHRLSFIFFLKKDLNKSDSIISISKGTSSKLFINFKIKTNLILNPPLLQSLVNQKESKVKEINNSKFFLFVGNSHSRKNLNLLITYFKKIIPKIDNFNLVIAGNFKKKQSTSNHFVKYIYSPSASELKYLYKNATALIIPSSYEGYGMPAMEASYFGLPIFGNEIDEIKEASGNKGYYFILNYDSFEKVLLKHKTSLHIRNPSKIYSNWDNKVHQIYNL